MISTALTTNNLYICADGSYFADYQQGSHAWVFSTSDKTILWKGAGPSFSHPDVMSPYRAELSGLTSILFILLWVTTFNSIETGSVTIYCDNTSALDRIFTAIRQSNNPLQQLIADIDLISCARDLLLQLPVDIQIRKEWVKGHYTDSNRELQHDLNDMADELAVQHNSTRRSPNAYPPLISPMSEAEILQDNHIITSCLPQIIRKARHLDDLQQAILHQTKWDLQTFHKVHWNGHKAAFTSHGRIHRVSITKLVHGLYQTKERDNQFYGTPAAYPCCLNHSETLIHVFSCPSDATTHHRADALQKLTVALDKHKTPPAVTKAITQGLHVWALSQHNSERLICSPSRGTVFPADILLTQAFVEQTTTLGWYQFLRGRISKKWGSAYKAYKVGNKQCSTNEDAWVKHLILSIWNYSISLWKFRNGLVHGTTLEEQHKKVLTTLQNQVQEEYRLFQTDPFLVSPQYQSLFLRKSLEDRLQMGRDSLASWLRSVKEAKVY
jgi:hypothetical protein